MTIPGSVSLDDLRTGKISDDPQSRRKCLTCGSVGDRTIGCARPHQVTYKGYCSSCAVDTDYHYLLYDAQGKGATRLSLMLLGSACPKCEQVWVYKSELERIDSFAQRLPAGTRIIRELGIQTNSNIEIFARAEVELERSVWVRSGTVRLRLQRQTKLFKKCLEYITSFDQEHFGHEYSRTLHVEPAPPYSPGQVSEIWRGVAALARKIDSRVHFWAAHFGDVFPDDIVRSASKLLDFMDRKKSSWPRPDAVALVVCIINRESPGTFVNCYRLLELIVDVALEADLVADRWNRAIDHKVFLKSVKGASAPLKDRLRQVVQRRLKPDAQPLQELWAILRSGQRFDPIAVYHEIATARNSMVHASDSQRLDDRLPWDLPPFDAISLRLLELMTEIVKV